MGIPRSTKSLYVRLPRSGSPRLDGSEGGTVQVPSGLSGSTEVIASDLLRGWRGRRKRLFMAAGKGDRNGRSTGRSTS